MSTELIATAAFFEHINKFKEAWVKGRELAKQAKEAFNGAVKSLHEQNPEWSLNKILSRIAQECEGLEGFSTRQLYRDLDDENRTLLQKNVLTLSKNNVKVEEIPQTQTQTPPKPAQAKPEYSITLEKPDINDDIEIPLSDDHNNNNNNNNNNIVFSETENYIEQYKELQTTKQLLKEARHKIEELEDKIQELSKLKKPVASFGNKFSFEYDFELPNGDIVPFTVTAFPDKKSGYVILNKKRLSK